MQPISIEIHPTSTRETGDFVFNEGLNGADDAFVCDYQLGAGHCGLFSLASGATWTGTLRLADVPPSIYRLEIEVESLYHFLADPDAVKASDEVEVEREDEPAPTRTPPADSGGGGAVGAWWLLLLPALLRRRKMVGDTGIEPVTPAV